MKRAKDNKLEYISSSPIGGASGHWITPHPAVHVSPAPCAALPIAALSHDDGGEMTGDGRRLSRGLTNSRPFAPPDPHVHLGRTTADAILDAEPALDDAVARPGAVPPAAVAGGRRPFAAIPAGGRPAAVPHHADDHAAADGRPVPSERAAAAVLQPVHSYAAAQSRPVA